MRTEDRGQQVGLPPLRVLVINQYFPPDTSATAAVFADTVDALIRAGHKVTVLCGRPSYEPTERYSWLPLRVERQAHRRIERVGSSAFDRNRLRRRLLNYLSFLFLAALRALIGPRPDVVIVGSDPPLAILIAVLAARGRSIVYYLQDVHPDAALAAGWLAPGGLARAWDRLHSWGLRRAEKVVCIGDVMAERVHAKGVQGMKIKVIPHGAWPARGEADSEVVEQLRASSAFVAAHAGNLGTVGAWHTIETAAEYLKGEVRFVLVGEGVWSNRFTSTSVTVLPFRPAKELPSVMLAGDLQIITLLPGMEGLVVPSKLYTILAYGRPILAVVSDRSEVARIVTQWECGIVADPSDPEDVAKKVTWAKENPEQLVTMSQRAFEAARSFERGSLLKRLVTEVEQVAAADGTIAASSHV